MVFFAIWLFQQESEGVFARIWGYLTQSFTFGRITVSISSVLVGVIVFTSTVVVARYSGALIERRIARRGHIDPGLRYTMSRLIKYVLISVGTLVAVKQAFAVDLTSIAVLFTALSVGIGFGLQYLAADIASGFILLFERPIRVGDRITIGDDEGDVESINLRTTLVMTNDRVSIIVPNSRLVSQRVINWSYGDPRARIPIEVGVSYDSDVELVTQTLIEAARDIEYVLTDRPPTVQFMKFNDFSLDFRLLVWTSHPRQHVQIRSDVNYRIFELFTQRNIQIPFPIRDVRVQREAGADGDGSLLAADDEPRMQD